MFEIVEIIINPENCNEIETMLEKNKTKTKKKPRKNQKNKIQLMKLSKYFHSLLNTFLGGLSEMTDDWHATVATASLLCSFVYTFLNKIRILLMGSL